jgi:hypothetical protein
MGYYIQGETCVGARAKYINGTSSPHCSLSTKRQPYTLACMEEGAKKYPSSSRVVYGMHVLAAWVCSDY